MRDLTVITNRPDISPRVISINDFKNFENEQGIKFPVYLIEFLMKYEGCEVEEQCYLQEDKKIWRRLNMILFLRKNDITMSIESVLEKQRFYEETGWLPFGIDAGGFEFSISLKEETIGQVFICMDEDDYDEPYRFVAKSFDEFINGLITEERAIEAGF